MSSWSSIRKMLSYRFTFDCCKCSAEMPSPTFPRNTTASASDWSSFLIGTSISREPSTFSGASTQTMRQDGSSIKETVSKGTLCASRSQFKRWLIFCSIRCNSCCFFRTACFCCNNFSSIRLISLFLRKSSISDKGISNARKYLIVLSTSNCSVP